MDLPLRGNDRNPLQIWPALPENECEFWLYVANAAQEHGLAIPEFMLPVSDLTLIQQRLARWRRARDIEHWKQTLGNLPHTHRPHRAPTGELDLRVMITDQEVRLQWQRPGVREFELLKQRQARQLDADYQEGAVRFTPEAELIWQFFSDLPDYKIKLEFLDSTDEAADILGRVMRSRLLESRIVGLDGRPLARPQEPLRWEVIPAKAETDDYRFRLVQANGALPPPILGVLPGLPALYVTEQAIFLGPETQTDVLQPTQETRIPAPAVERASGVAFLQSLGAELPARLRGRVQVLR